MTDLLKKAELKFTKEFMGAMAAFLIILAVRTFVLEGYEFNPITKALVIITPLFPLFVALWSYIRHYRSMDEFMQRITGEAFLWSTGITTFFAIGYGLLEYEMMVPHLNLSWIFPSILMGSGFARGILLWMNSREE